MNINQIVSIDFQKYQQVNRYKGGNSIITDQIRLFSRNKYKLNTMLCQLTYIRVYKQIMSAKTTILL